MSQMSSVQFKLGLQRPHRRLPLNKIFAKYRALDLKSIGILLSISHSSQHHLNYVVYQPTALPSAPPPEKQKNLWASLLQRTGLITKNKIS